MRRRNPTQKPIVDIVTVTGGRWDFLRECVAAVQKQTIPVNFILIDNASNAEERIQNQSLFENASTKRLQTHSGFPVSNNEAARMGSAPLILFLNDDCILQEDTVEKMVRTMDDDTIGICGAKLLFPLNSTSPIRPAGKVQHVGLGLDIRGDVIHPLSGWSADNPRTCISRDVFAVTGACFMIRRSLFNQARGFDVMYGNGTYEDADLSLKIRSMGKRVFVNTDAIAYHYTGATAEKKQVAFPLQNNSMTFKSRWIGTPFMAWDSWSWY